MHVLTQVLKQFRAIAATSGNKSQDRKRGMITTMLAASKPQEAGYIMRALQVPDPDTSCISSFVCRH